MKKQCILKALVFLLIFSLCISIAPEYVSAVSNASSAGNELNISESDISIDTTAEDFLGELDEIDVPEIIGYETAIANNHVGRLYSDEGTDLNKVVFLNCDGSKTMYLFDFPVKYIDDNGSVQDVRLEIAESPVETGKFYSAANDAVATFSANFTDGIFLNGNDVEIQLIPILPDEDTGTTSLSATNGALEVVTDISAQRIDRNTIEYQYDDKTTVQYSITYTGFKEDIVVSEYTGQTTYPFHLYTNGLALEEIDGSYYLVDDNGDVKATIGDIIIFTADERNNTFGDIVPTTIVENEEYLLNIVVDANFLADPDTVYPIRIDPTIEVNYDISGASAIEDITISTTTNYAGSHTSLYVGRRSSDIARVLIRFPGLDLSGISQAAITDASLRVRDLMCEGEEMNIYCHAFTGNVWDANAATWSNVNPNSYITTPLDTVAMSWSIGDAFDPVHWYSFDITTAVQGWADGRYTKSKGLILKMDDAIENGDTIKNRTFGSYNRASYKPTLSITYTDEGAGGGNSFDTAEDFSYVLDFVWTMVANEKRYYKFTPSVSGEYMFYSTDAADGLKGDPIVNLYDSNFQLIDDADDEAYNLNFRISANLVAGRTYYFELGHHGTNTGMYLVNVTRAASLSGNYYFKNAGSLQYMDIHGPNAQEFVHQWTFTAGNQTKWTATKQSDGYYTIRSLYGDEKYVGISDTYSSIENIVLFSSISDSCKWKIYKDYNGNLIFETKQAPGKVLYVSNNNVGTELGLVPLSSIVDDRSFWKELRYKYDYTIAHYYDQGFVARFPEEVNLLNTYQNICSDALLAVFGVSTGRSVQSYTSCADTCVGSPVTLAKTLNTCGHTSAHKTTSALCLDGCDRFGYVGDTTTRCIWTGHLLTVKNSCSFPSPHNTVIMNLGNVTNSNNENLTGEILIKQIRLYELMHEASHQLGAADHYCYDLTSNDCNNPKNDCWRCDHDDLAAEPNCIMSSHYYDIESMVNDGTIAEIYCNQCKSSTHSLGIETHLKEHHD